MASTVPILLLLCACTFALPKEMFTRKVKYCAPQTPCSWGIYEEPRRDDVLEVTNTYCICAVGQVCVRDEDDLTSKSYVYRCRNSENTS